MISIKGLTKRYDSSAGSVAVLDDLSIEIESNSFFTLLGPSGCGKSTLLRCIAGLEHPSEGEISIDDQLVYSSHRNIAVAPYRRNIGMVFQSYAIWPHMTVGQNVAFPLEVRGEREVRQRVLEALEMVGLGGLDQRYASKLSGGQQQRVALARAIVGRPQILLLDEPLSNLDAALREQMRAELLRIQRTLKITTVFVTHDQTEALSMSDRIAVMSGGHFVEVAAPHELYTRPRTAFAARFVGGANLLDGRATRAGELTAIETSFGRLLSTESASGPVQLFVRLERITRVDRVSEVNQFECRIRERRYAGDTSEFELAPLAGHAEARLNCRFSSDFEGVPGDTVCIGIEPRHVHILAADETAAN